MSSLINVPKTRQFVQLDSQLTGTSFNYSNFIYHLPRTVNQLTKLVGSDLVLQGMDVDITINSSNTVTAKIQPGLIITDNTLIEFSSTNTITLPNLNTFDITGQIVVFVQFQYLQTVAVNSVKLGITHINQRGVPFDIWDHNKNRIVLNFYNIIRSQTSPDDVINFQYGLNQNLLSDYILISSKEYYRNGYSPSNMSMNKYLTHFLQRIGSVTQFPDNMMFQGDVDVHSDLRVREDAVVHGSLNVDGVVNANSDVRIADDLQVYGERTLIDSQDVQVGAQRLILNRNESCYGTQQQYSGLTVNRGTLPPATLYFDEETDKWMVGIQGGEFYPIPKQLELSNIDHTSIIDWDDKFSESFSDILIGKTTDFLREGDRNLYFTIDRVFSVLIDRIVAGNGIKVNTVNNRIIISADVTNTPATNTTLGLVKIGQGLNISNTGLLSTTSQTDNNFTNDYKNKLDNIEPNANNYTHPSFHPATVIIPDLNHRFVTDIQINKWDQCVDRTHGDQLGGSLHSLVTSQSPGFMGTQDKINLELLWSKYINGDFGDMIDYASFVKAGIIKVGAGLTIDEDGFLSVIGSTIGNILSFTSPQERTLIGTILTEIELAWVIEGSIRGQSLDNSIPPIIKTTRTYTHTNLNISENVSYVLTIQDDIGMKNKTLDIQFLNHCYWGASIIPPQINESFLNSLNNKEIVDPRNLTWRASANTDEYLWFACPKRVATFKFYFGMLEGGFDGPVSAMIMINDAGYEEEYFIYRSAQASLGDVTIDNRST